MDASKSSNANQLFLRASKPPMGPPIQITEPPWSEAKASDAKERVQDLRINLDPFPAWGVDVVASRGAHRRCSIAK